MTEAEGVKHSRVAHTPLLCPCGSTLFLSEVPFHRDTSTGNCPSRIIVCSFCGDAVGGDGAPSDARDRLRGLTAHESRCGR